MRKGANIFCVIFILVFGMLHLQPMFSHNIVEKEQTCSKTKCSKQKPAEKNKDCADKGCNPFVPCAMGSCCYLVENFYSYSTNSILIKQNLPSYIDGLLLNRLSECWHPPEMLS